MALKINNRFSMFQEVYLLSDSEQYVRQVVQINIMPNNLLVYMLACNGETSEHYEDEITIERRVI